MFAVNHKVKHIFSVSNDWIRLLEKHEVPLKQEVILKKHGGKDYSFVSKEVGLVFSIANTLRGTYKSDKYKDVIIPMIIIRRLECALASTKDMNVVVWGGIGYYEFVIKTLIIGFIADSVSLFNRINCL